MPKIGLRDNSIIATIGPSILDKKLGKFVLSSLISLSCISLPFLLINLILLL